MREAPHGRCEGDGWPWTSRRYPCGFFLLGLFSVMWPEDACQPIRSWCGKGRSGVPSDQTRIELAVSVPCNIAYGVTPSEEVKSVMSLFMWPTCSRFVAFVLKISRDEMTSTLFQQQQSRDKTHSPWSLGQKLASIPRLFRWLINIPLSFRDMEWSRWSRLCGVKTALTLPAKPQANSCHANSTSRRYAVILGPQVPWWASQTPCARRSRILFHDRSLNLPAVYQNSLAQHLRRYMARKDILMLDRSPRAARKFVPLGSIFVCFCTSFLPDHCRLRAKKHNYKALEARRKVVWTSSLVEWLGQHGCSDLVDRTAFISFNALIFTDFGKVFGQTRWWPSLLNVAKKEAPLGRLWHESFSELRSFVF